MSKIIHRDELALIRRAVGNLGPEFGRDDGTLALALLATTMRLFDHIDAMRDHRCFFKWSAVKGQRAGGPVPTCTYCGFESPTQRAKAEAESLAAFLDQALADHRTTGDVTVADGTRGMERGR